MNYASARAQARGTTAPNDRSVHPRQGRTRRIACGLLLLALGVSCRSADPEGLRSDVPPPRVTLAEPIALGPNDIVHVGVYGHPELSSPDTLNGFGSRIDPTGRVHLPLVGGIEVAGLTLGEATARVTEALAEFVQEPRVHVSLLEWSARRFYVFGEVNRPGTFVLDRPMNAYQGLSLAGGFTRGADRDEVWLLRPEPVEAPERYRAYPFDAAHPSNDGLAALAPEDILFVRRTGAGRFADEVLPILSGISSSLSSVATVLLIEDRLDD